MQRPRGTPKHQSVRRRRLDPALFRFPIREIRAGYYSDKYFVRTRDILIQDGKDTRVTMQVFAKKRAVLCGTDEAIALLKQCADRPDRLVIRALYDGDIFEPWETVMTIEGEYRTFAHLETLYLGILARRTAVATNVRAVVDAAAGKPVLFFAPRFDHFFNQAGDGYAAHVGGAAGVSTDAGGKWWGAEGIGTVPHALIAAYGGNTTRAALAFDRYEAPDVHRIVLVDFDNDCVRIALEVARALGEKLWAVRLDTAENLRDVSVEPKGMDSLGVCPELVWKVRRALDREGFQHVKIVLSGGFDADKVKLFVELGVPFDAVGVGSWFFKNRVDFTADVVLVDGKPCAKAGRCYRPNPRLSRVP